MENIKATNAPFQYSNLGVLVKKFLHTSFGARIGFILGLSGFNKIEAQIWRFKREYKDGDILSKKEVIRIMSEMPDGTKRYGVYTLERRQNRSFNSRVDAGAALCASLISGTTLGGLTSPLAAKYIALSTSTLTPAKGDTTLTGESVATGLARALASAGSYTLPSTLDGAASYVLSKTFTNTSGGTVTILSAAIFDAVSTGNMYVEGNLSTSAPLDNNDQLTINWTINL